MSAARVHAPDGPYAAAVRWLPVSAALAPERLSADIAVVAGQGWLGEAAQARRSAAVVIAAGDLPGGAAEIDALTSAGGAHVVLERGRLWRDLVDDALGGRNERGASPPRLIVAECLASSVELPAAVRDALGWGRELAGGLVLADSSADVGAASALLLGGPDRIPVLLRATVALVPRAVLRITAHGEVTTEVVLDDLSRRRSVSTLDSSGRAAAPARLESVERFTLRRALAALAGTERRDDLAELARDAALTEAVLGGVG